MFRLENFGATPFFIIDTISWGVGVAERVFVFLFVYVRVA
jgi:hypothetical protein